MSIFEKKSPYKFIFITVMILFLGVPGILLLSSKLMAAGTFAEGRLIVKLLSLEGRGLMYKSFEGDAIRTVHDDDDDCDAEKRKKYLCYKPKAERFQLSVRPEAARVVNFMLKNRGKVMVVYYKIHRIEPVALETSFEVLDVYAWQKNPPSNFKKKLRVRETGSRAFDVYGRILRLEYQGTVLGTYEGLYLDWKRGKVHPFSITDSDMARYAYDTMLFSKPFHLGISVAIVTGARKSNYDIYEVNYLGETGSVEETQPPKKEEKEDN